MAHKPEHKALVDSLIDEQIDAKRLVAQAEKGSPNITRKMMSVARQLVELGKKGKIQPKQARALWWESWKLLTLADHVQNLGDIQQSVDSHLDAQLKQAQSLNRPLREVGAIRNADIKARENEKAGVLNAAGVIE